MLLNFNLLGVLTLTCVLSFSTQLQASYGLWEKKYGVDALVEGEDSDNDGITDFDERKAGTDPYDAESALAIDRQEIGGSKRYLLWPSAYGVSYQVEYNKSLSAETWESLGQVMTGDGGQLSLVLEGEEEEAAFYRVKTVSRLPEGTGVSSLDELPDSDQDGIADVHEYLMGADPVINAANVLHPSIIDSPVTKLRWQSEKGKIYQLYKRQSGGEWKTEGAKRKGSGQQITVIVEQDLGAEYLLDAEDLDSDGDGVTDWEEYEIGLDPFLATTDPRSGDDSAVVQQRLNVQTETVAVEIVDPVANVSDLSPAKIRVRRVGGGVDKISFTYAISGTAVPDTDYMALSGEAEIPFGGEYVDLEVQPLAQSQLTSFRTVYVNVQANGFHFDGSTVGKVHLIRELSLNVRDYGAVGDGYTDDTQAIQAAINALEADSSKNTLYFPAGKYRLATRKFGDETYYGRYKHLKLGETDLANRDLVIRGEPGAVLYSDVSPKRSHILVAMASFRSLAVYDISFEKSKTPLEAGPADGADGVSLVRVDSRDVYEIRFEDCTFNNCHGALATYGRGTDTRGNCKNLILQRCRVLNPYGTNTTDIGSHWGGGQQIVIRAWVKRAVYESCIFEGGGEDMSDHYYCPAGRLKDGCHFGNPLRLEFYNNIVRKMGVEAVFQTNKSTYMTTTEEAFEIPPADGTTVVSIQVMRESSSYVAGQLISIRRPHDGVTPGKNNIFRIVGYTDSSSQLSFVNDGYEGNDAPGTFMKKSKPVYLQVDSGNYADIRHNYVDGRLPHGAEYTNGAGIVLATKGRISDNVVVGFTTGLLCYQEAATPVFPGIDGVLMCNNFIEMRDPSQGSSGFKYGISTFSSGALISSNTIVSPISVKSTGIALRGNDTVVRDNIIQCVQKVVNGYYSDQRSTGILVGNESNLVNIMSNTTRNFDVGVGPSPNQWTLHYVSGHNSVDDEMSVDHHGLVDPEE
ncbi:Pectate lyase superfamily protein [Rubritalea squalenifaciens DSM 18772]|uniref:Pectate lyase superfamily protein n=1 Tax=Rubritalea squalenifaciens DSM 18772 TaxID=1123071 RepID=A0A1M6DHU6_9BACT|nr:thrombospondin type 3 repeat-containing protein [Rubritalea squalenifaciens]SHI72578.1 Pectate lyase superfamily protein [Rubritalea squalenifaciens DSM 18772]